MNFVWQKMNRQKRLVCISICFGGGGRGEGDKHVCTFVRRSEALILCIGEICQYCFKFVSDNLNWQAVHRCWFFGNVGMIKMAYIWNWAKIRYDKLLLGANLPCFSKIRLYEEAELLNVKLISSSKVVSEKH